MILIGRPTADPDIRYTGVVNPMAIATFTIAVTRLGKKDEADFIWCVAFKNMAELIKEYVHKGDRIAIEGHWYAESYQKNGEWKQTNKCVIDRIEFMENKKDSQSQGSDEETIDAQDDPDLPF